MRSPISISKHLSWKDYQQRRERMPSYRRLALIFVHRFGIQFNAFAKYISSKMNQPDVMEQYRVIHYFIVVNVERTYYGTPCSLELSLHISLGIHWRATSKPSVSVICSPPFVIRGWRQCIPIRKRQNREPGMSVMGQDVNVNQMTDLRLNSHNRSRICKQIKTCQETLPLLGCSE